jgi:hypothetical protein
MLRTKMIILVGVGLAVVAATMAMARVHPSGWSVSVSKPRPPQVEFKASRTYSLLYDGERMDTVEHHRRLDGRWPGEFR